jgi:hypothetical protein
MIGPQFPTPEEQERQLLAARWKRIRRGIYESPFGSWFRGPHAAWLVAHKWGWL